MTEVKSVSFFSIGFELVTLNEFLTYDLYVNSSTSEKREHFVKVFATGGILEKDDVENFRKKYFQLYVLESQRDQYLLSLVKSKNVSVEKKTEVIKNGAIKYLDTLFSSDKSFTTEVLGKAIEGCRESVEYMVDIIQDHKITDIQNLIGNLSFHDFYTYDHSVNVSMYSISIYKALRPTVTKGELSLIGLGGLLHDLGKLKIPTELINKSGRLDESEYKEIMKHPALGRDLIEQEIIKKRNTHISGDVDFETIARIAGEHHESYDGTGYPIGLKDREIHVLARIVAIADFFDAITTKRSYHEALDTDAAVEVMGRCSGKKLDPMIFDVFVENTTRLVRKRNVTMELAGDFDPSQPHDVLPLERVKATKMNLDLFKKDDKGFGEVKKTSEKKNAA